MLSHALQFLSAALCAGCLPALAGEGPATALEAATIRAKVQSVTEAHNRMLRSGSTPADIEQLFAHYCADFVYEHERYGGRYSRAELHGNSLRGQAAGRYKLEADDYRLLDIWVGHNAALVKRLDQAKGLERLTVFEFKGDCISRAMEYW